MPTPPPAPEPVNWGYTDRGPDEPAGAATPSAWDYDVWVRWSNNTTTRRSVNIPRPEGADVDVNARVWETIHSLIREGPTWRHPDAEPLAEPELPDASGPAPYGPPEAPPAEPEDPLGPPDTEPEPDEDDIPPGGWFRP